MNGLSLVWVIAEWPMPALTEAKRATYSLIRELTRNGCDIQLCWIGPANGLSREAEARRELGVSALHVLTLPSGASLMERLNHLTKTLKARFPVVVFDQWPSARLFGEDNRFSTVALPCPSIYRSVDGDPPARPAAGGWRGAWDRLAGGAGAKEKFGNTVLASVDAVACASPRELRALKKRVPYFKGDVVPVAYFPENPLPPPRSAGLNIHYLGRLDAAATQEGLRWFLGEVWPQVHWRRPDAAVHVSGVGTERPEDLAWTRKWRVLPRVTFSAGAPHLGDFYRAADLIALPVFLGPESQTRAFEGACFGRACLGNSFAVEGVGFERGVSYFQVEDTEACVQTLLEMTPLKCRAAGLAAHRHVQARFRTDRAADTFLRLVEGVFKSRAFYPIMER